MKRLLLTGAAMFLAVSIAGPAHALAAEHYLEYTLSRTASDETGVFTYEPETTVSVEPFYPSQTMYGGYDASGYMDTIDSVEYGSFGASYDGQIDFFSGKGWVDLSAHRNMKWVDTVMLSSDILEKGTPVGLLATIKADDTAYFDFEFDDGSSTGFTYGWPDLQSSMLVQARVGDNIKVTGTWDIEDGISGDAENGGVDGYIAGAWGNWASFYIDPQMKGVDMTSASGTDYRGFYIAETSNNFGGKTHNVPEASTAALLISAAGCAFAGRGLARKKTLA